MTFCQLERSLVRKGSIAILCVLCEEALENSWHAFLSCPFSIACWVKVDLWRDIELVIDRSESFTDFFFGLKRCISRDRFVNFVMVLWSLWHRRNMKVWENKNESCDQVVLRASSVWGDWNLAKGLKVHAEGQGPKEREDDQVWSKPNSGVLKINIDADFPPNAAITCWGMCLRNDEGSFVGARTCWCPSRFEVKEGEANGLLQALCWAANLNLNSVIFELDAQTVVTSVNSISKDLSEFGSIIKECRSILSCNPNFLVKFVRRQANMIVHSLARVTAS